MELSCGWVSKKNVTNNAEYPLPKPEVLDEDLVQWVNEKEDLVATRVELLDEDTLGQVVSRSTHIGQVEYLR